MREKGVSLVEILVAVFILLSSMLPLWGLMGSSHRQVIRFSEEIIASQLTVEILEQIRNSKAVNVFLNQNNSFSFTLTSDSTISLGNQSAAPLLIKVGTFESYLEPKLTITGEVVNNKYLPDKTIGCIVTLVMKYKSKEGKELEYKLRGFVNGKL